MRNIECISVKLIEFVVVVVLIFFSFGDSA